MQILIIESYINLLANIRSIVNRNVVSVILRISRIYICMTVRKKMSWWKICCLILHVSLHFHNQRFHFKLLDLGPDFSRASWLDVKETLGFDFPNVSIHSYVFCC